MQEILAVALHSMHQDMSSVDHVAMNISNSLTPGYKREVLAVRPFGDLVQGSPAPAASAPQTGPADQAAGAEEVLTDASAGTLKQTGGQLDLALDGAGYFEVATPSGPAYTRQGNFKIDARGRLVTGDGYALQGKGGDLVLSGANPVIDGAGYVSETAATPGEDGQPVRTTVGQIKIVRFERTSGMHRVGHGLMSEGGTPTQAADGEVNVRQGYLENSNVNSLQEMLELMQSMRHFESMQRIVQGYDELLGTAVRKLGDV